MISSTLNSSSRASSDDAGGGQYQTDRQTDRARYRDRDRQTTPVADSQTHSQTVADRHTVRRYQLVPDKTNRQRTENVGVRSR